MEKTSITLKEEEIKVKKVREWKPSIVKFKIN